ncbi:hypothetical protein TanjilG_24999 [Lupinus angustifolius]|uniref:Uncharacterized protein n=1 Tax=Lupinus angustifolius TaxID=3871 RepID=A0A1J7HC69_LUPAN|nr:hypothetical protein TanjilG_24999 [Lupinus angustifolius]
MYFSMGRWAEAKVVRDLMSDNQIGKNPGYSCWVSAIMICISTILENKQEVALVGV